MTKKVTKITVYKTSEKCEAYLRRLEKAKELIREVLDDEEIRNQGYANRLATSARKQLNEAFGSCSNAETLLRELFTEETVTETEEIID